MKINILAIEKYLPKNKVLSEELDKLANGKVGRIEKNSGVRSRHHVSDSENISDMGASALKRALAKARLKPSDIDLLISASGSFDYPIPHNSAIIKSKITDDTVTFACFDVDSTCLSFMNALDIAHIYMQASRYKRIAIVTSEISSRALTPDDEKTFGLFGDGAVAIIIESSGSEGYVPRYVDFKNFTSGAMCAHIPIGGAVNRGVKSAMGDSGYYFKMDGRNLISLTTKHIGNFVATMEQSIGYNISDFDKIITHQTSKFGNDFFRKKFNLTRNKVVETLPFYGNCIAASIPLGLELILNSEFEPSGKKVLLLGSGAGLTFGAMVLEF